MAPHSSTLAWKIPWTEEPGRLQSMGSLRVGHDWTTSLSLFTFMHWRRKWQPTPVFFPGESQGWGEPGGLLSMGLHRVGHDWRNLAAAAAADMYLEMELLSRMVVLVLIFWKTFILFSTIVVPIYIPINSVGAFSFLHILSNTSFWWEPLWQVTKNQIL